MLHPDLALWLYLVKKLLEYLTPLFSLGHYTPVELALIPNSCWAWALLPGSILVLQLVTNIW